MRLLLILLLAGALAVGGYLTKPTLEAHRAHANEVLAEKGKEGDVIGDLIGSVINAATRKDDFEDMLVATRYTVRSGETVLVECLGVFSQFFCSTPEKK